MSGDKYLVHFLSEKGSDGDIVTDDVTENVYEGVFVGTGGDVALIPLRGTVVQVWKNLPNAFTIPVKTRIIKTTGTTALNLIGL